MLSIIIPTYKERNSVCKTIKDIIKEIPKSISYEIIVSDDDSPDKTWDFVQTTFKTNKNVKVLRRVNKVRGLSPAVIEAFSMAKGDYLLVMDADGQHDQKIIPKMLTAIKNNDIVIGSRFVPGGSVSGWSRKRIFVSKVAAFMAKPLLDNKVKDPMSGFFMIKKELFSKIKNKINPLGYKILLEILFSSPKAAVSEVSFRFGLREAGESKLGSKVILEYLLMLFKQAIHKYKKFIKFCFVGASGVVVNVGLLFLLTEYAGIFYLASSAIAIEASIITNFLLNNFWTWKKRGKGFFSRLVKFNLVSIIALVINMGILFFFTETVGLWYILSNLIGIAFATVINFFLNDKWTFK